MYEHGKIYRLLAKDGHYYIGSTTQSLNLRRNKHKNDSNLFPERKAYKYFNTVSWENVTIELVEAYSCKTKKELNAREDFHIKAAKDDELCLNVNRAHVTKEEKLENMKEYYKEHKEEIMDYQQFYGAVNKEKVDEYQENYRKENAEKRREYTRQYTEEHHDEVKAAKREHYQKNKERLLAENKKYVQENKEKVNARKLAWAHRKRKENTEAIAEERAKKREARKKKAEARIEYDNTIIKCECGGSYQNYRKKRHDSSKLHLNYISNVVICTKN
jgi:hypothetical protein